MRRRSIAASSTSLNSSGHAHNSSRVDVRGSGVSVTKTRFFGAQEGPVGWLRVRVLQGLVSLVKGIIPLTWKHYRAACSLFRIICPLPLAVWTRPEINNAIPSLLRDYSAPVNLKTDLSFWLRCPSTEKDCWADLKWISINLLLTDFISQDISKFLLLSFEKPKPVMLCIIDWYYIFLSIKQFTL